MAERALRIAPGFLGVALLASCASMAQVPPAARANLAPAGTLRAGINYGNAILATRDPASGESRGAGAAFDLLAAGEVDALAGLRQALGVAAAP